MTPAAIEPVTFRFVAQYHYATAVPIYIYIHIYIYSLLDCLTTGPKPLPKPGHHIVRSRAPSFKWQYPLLSLKSSSSFLRLLPRLSVTSILPFIYPSTTGCRRQFLRKTLPIQLAFRLLISCRMNIYKYKRVEKEFHWFGLLQYVKARN